MRKSNKNNKLIVGTVQFGLDYGINNKGGKVALAEVFKILDLAKLVGIQTLDSAEVYGNAHEIIGGYHKVRNSKFKIITKIPTVIDGDTVSEKVKKYKTQLALDEIDTLMFHSYASYLENSSLIEELLLLKEKGEIHKIGVSIYTNEEALELLEDERIELVQLPFNLLDNWSLRGETLKKLKENGKEVHTRSAFLQGLFFKDLKVTDPLFKAFGDEVSILKQLGIDNGFTMQQMALLYCLQQDCIDKVVIGVDNEHQLSLNLAAVKMELSSQIMSIIDAIKVKNFTMLNPSKW